MDVTARLAEAGRPGAEQLSERLWWELPATYLSEEDKDSARSSLLRRQGWLPNPCTVVVEELYVPALTDYQPEAVGWALEGWLAEELGREDMDLKLRYDKASNRYVESE